MGKDEINAFLGAGTIYEGKLNFQGAVRIDGTYTGQITSEGSLIVGKDAVISGEIHVGELLLTGKFTGDVYAKKRVVVHRGGVIEGTVNTQALIMEEGGILQGQINMRNQAPAQRRGESGQDA